MNSTLRDARPINMRTSLAIFVVTLSFAGPASSQFTRESDDGFRLHSASFENNTTLPLSAVDNITVNGSNLCSLGGAAGGNQSPQLSWSDPPRGTHSFAVIVFDTTASFSHWGIYNITGDATGLPANAGVAASTYGTQVLNDFGDPHYDGPCPPTNLPPNVHHYVFTVYALSSELTVPASANFPANVEALFRALLDAAMRGEVLGRASITGLYSTTPGT
jgi:Raf kinase inhibitor-like YbhB/YbcL family protein